MSTHRSPLPKGVRKYIRLQKAVIRKSTLDTAAQKDAIGKLYQQYGTNRQDKRDK